MTCETAHDLILESAESPLLAEHVAGCEECHLFQESQHELDQALAERYAPPPLTPAFRERLENKLRQERRRDLWTWMPALVPLASGAVVTALSAALLPLPASTVWAAGTTLIAASYCLQALVTFWFEELEDL